MNAMICDVCGKVGPSLGGKGWREVKPMGVIVAAFTNATLTHICPDCWPSMVALRQAELGLT